MMYLDVKLQDLRYTKSINQFYFNTIYLYKIDSGMLTCQTKKNQVTNVKITLQHTMYMYYMRSAY